MFWSKVVKGAGFPQLSLQWNSPCNKLTESSQDSKSEPFRKERDAEMKSQRRRWKGKIKMSLAWKCFLSSLGLIHTRNPRAAGVSNTVWRVSECQGSWQYQETSNTKLVFVLTEAPTGLLFFLSHSTEGVWLASDFQSLISQGNEIWTWKVVSILAGEGAGLVLSSIMRCPGRHIWHVYASLVLILRGSWCSAWITQRFLPKGVHREVLKWLWLLPSSWLWNKLSPK